jgi:hypothetical protein
MNEQPFDWKQKFLNKNTAPGGVFQLTIWMCRVKPGGMNLTRIRAGPCKVESSTVKLTPKDQKLLPFLKKINFVISSDM